MRRGTAEGAQELCAPLPPHTHDSCFAKCVERVTEPQKRLNFVFPLRWFLLLPEKISASNGWRLTAEGAQELCAERGLQQRLLPGASLRKSERERERERAKEIARETATKATPGCEVADCFGHPMYWQR